jgi:hypothetical protein
MALNLPDRLEHGVDDQWVDDVTKAQPYTAAHGDHHDAPGTGPAIGPTTDFYANKAFFEHTDSSGEPE